MISADILAPQTASTNTGQNYNDWVISCQNRSGGNCYPDGAADPSNPSTWKCICPTATITPTQPTPVTITPQPITPTATSSCPSDQAYQNAIANCQKNVNCSFSGERCNASTWKCNCTTPTPTQSTSVGTGGSVTPVTSTTPSPRPSATASNLNDQIISCQNSSFPPQNGKPGKSCSWVYNSDSDPTGHCQCQTIAPDGQPTGTPWITGSKTPIPTKTTTAKTSGAGRITSQISQFFSDFWYGLLSLLGLK